MLMEIAFHLTGIRGAFWHRDDVTQADELEAWRKDPKNKDISKAGDDRSPPHTWQSYLYHDGEYLAVPFANIQKCLVQGATKKIMKGKTTYKDAVSTAVSFEVEHFSWLVGGKQIPFAPIVKIKDMPFAEQFEAVKKMGFKLDVRRAPIGRSKHVRVRPYFAPPWEIKGSCFLDQTEKSLNFALLEEIWDLAGKRGLFDWRPSSKQSPGPYGTFTAKIKRV